VVDGVALRVGAALGEVVAGVDAGPSSALLLNRAVIVEVATLLAFPRTSQRPIRANLAEWAVGVAPTAGPADVLLAVLSGETVRVVEADLDAYLRARG